MTPRILLITGASDGLGRGLALRLAGDGSRLLLTGRDRGRTAVCLEECRRLGAAPDSSAFVADLSSLAEVSALAEWVASIAPRLDVLVNNAAVGPGAPGDTRELSRDGIELRMAVNYLAPRLLTRRLIPALRASGAGRIVNVASAGQQEIDFSDVELEHGYEGWRAYRQSKLALIMDTIEWSEQLAGQGVVANCLHPATMMDTSMVRTTTYPSSSTLDEGVAATLRLVADDEYGRRTGRYLSGDREAEPRAQAFDRAARRRLSAWADGVIDGHLGGRSAARPAG